MSHESTALRGVRCARFAASSTPMLRTFLLLTAIAAGIHGPVFAQCIIDSELLGGASSTGFAVIDGHRAVSSDGSSVELFDRTTGSWLLEQSIDLAGATLLSMGLEGSDLMLGLSGEVRLYLHDGISWTLDTVMDGATSGSADPGWGSALGHSGDLLAVGSPDTDETYFYTRVFDGTGVPTWIPAGVVLGTPGDGFGTEISMSGGYASISAPAAGQVLTFEYQGLALNQWILDATHPLAVASGTHLSLDQTAGETRLLLPSPLGANVFLRGPGGWAPETALIFSEAVDGPMEISGARALVTTTCGLKLFTRSASGWDSGFLIESFSALEPCVPIPAGTGSSILSLSGDTALVATTSGARFLGTLLFTDCNSNGILDSCDMAGGLPDCNGNGIPDSCDFATGTMDCNGNSILDPCEIAQGAAVDCNANGVPDSCDISSGGLDCNGNNQVDSCEIVAGTETDCNGNLIPDSCDALAGVAYDTLAPVITGMPTDITISIPSGQCESAATWTPPSATDACSAASLVGSHASGDLFLSGSTTVTYTATDDVGNVSELSFLVTILEPDPPFFISVPGNITSSADPNTCERSVSWPAPFALDANNCSFPGVTTDFPQGHIFPLGATSVTATATDGSGNSISQSFLVTVVDGTAPVIEQLPDISVSPVGTGCSAGASWSDPLVTDCTSVIMISNPPSPALITPAGRTVTYSAVDSAGNSSQMSFQITLIDDVPPVISGLPADMTLSPAQGQCGVTVDWPAPIVTDSCGVTAVTSSFDPPSTFGVGTTTVSYSASDPSGNETVASFSVTVLDTDFPQFVSTPGLVEVVTSSLACEAVVTWEEPVAIDCTSVTLTSSHTSGSVFPIGVQQVSYVATDIHGKSTTMTFSVSVTDGIPPTLVNPPADLTLVTNPGECTAIANWIPPTVIDDCGASTLTSTVDPGAVLPIGVIAVTYTAVDDSLNTTLHTFLVTVSDSSPPVFDTAPANLDVGTSLGLCSAQVFWTEPVATDDCTPPTTIQSHAPGAFFGLGTTTVTYTATDGSGNVATQAFDINVSDTEAPGFFQMPLDQSAPCLPGNCDASVTWAHPTVIDHCEPVTFQVSHNPGDVFPIGDTVVTYTSTDSALNANSQSLTVTVFDQESPTFTSTQADIQLSSEAGLCTAVVTWTEPTAVDLCGAVTLTSSHVSGTAFNMGTSTVTYTCTDDAGNTATLSFNVNVTDIELPQILSLPLDLSVGTDAVSCSGFATWSEPTTQDCDSATLISTHASGSAFSLGDTVVTYTATDPTGNQSTGSFTVTVIDEIAPQITSAPSGLTADTASGTCAATMTWAEATAEDHCSAVTISYSHLPGSSFPLGTTVVTATATDQANNSTSTTFSVLVTDSENPIQLSGPPTQVVLENPAGACELPGVWDSPVFADNCTAIPSVTSSHQPGDLFPIGETLVSYTCQDDALNQIVSTFTVVVVDTTPPTIELMPQDVAVTTASDSCEAAATWTLPEASDCSAFTMSSDLANGSSLPIGNHIVNFTFTDDHGNSSSDSILVTILDGELPQVSGTPADITVNNGAGSCGVIVVWTEPTTTDCTFSALETNFPSGSQFLVGVTTVVYTATDTNGNQTLTSFDITVLDIDAPVIENLPADIVLEAPIGACGAVASWEEPTGFDCVSHLMSSNLSSGASFPIGDTVVTYSAIDPAGNSSSASFTVTILDVESPQIDTFPADVTLDSSPGACTGIATWASATASDCTGISSLGTDHASGSEFPIGTTTVTVLATDGAGNSSSATFDVTVLDAGPPTISQLPGSLVLDNSPGQCSAVASWTVPIATDCSSVTMTGDSTSGSIFQVGIILVTYTAVDAAGNTSQASFEITILDTEAPFFTNVASQLSFDTTPGLCVGTATWDPAQAGDLCGSATATSSHSPGSQFPIGLTEVTHTATDESGNSSSMVTQITIVDAQAPTLDGMPADIVVDAPIGSCSALVSWVPPTATDCSTVTLESSATPDSQFPIGSHTVTYTATDDQGNTGTQFFTITVQDVESPTISLVPSDLVFNNDPGACGALVSWEDPLVTDCSDLDSVGSSIPNGSFLAPGDTLVTLTAIDIHGNQSQASFNITVIDQEAPTISGLAPLMTVSTDSGQCGATVFWVAPVIEDNCGVASTESSSAPATFFGIGETQITITATDVHGNSATAEMLLVVNDEESPQIVNIPGTIIAMPLPSTCTAPVTWAPLELIDNCSGGSITSSVPSGAEFPVGVTEVLVTATDASGNSSSGSFTVIVEECFSDFVRGDANDDGAVDISDAIVIIGYIFLGTQSDCHDALDCNDSGNIDISDAIHHFNTLFQGGPPPPPPFDVCGLDPTADSLVCELYQHCP